MVCSHGEANNRIGGIGHCRRGVGPLQPSAAPPARDPLFNLLPAQRRMHNLTTAPASERGPAPSLASYRRPCLSLVSGQPGPVRAAWALPKRVPARGRGRETELFKGLCKGERECWRTLSSNATDRQPGGGVRHPEDGGEGGEAMFVGATPLSLMGFLVDCLARTIPRWPRAQACWCRQLLLPVQMAHLEDRGEGVEAMLGVGGGTVVAHQISGRQPVTDN